MLSISRLGLFVVLGTLLTSCGMFDEARVAVTPNDEAEIRSAFLKVTSSPIIHWIKRYSLTEVSFITKDGTLYRGEKIGGKWQFTKPVIVAKSSGKSSNQTVERTATRLVSTRRVATMS